MKKYIVTIRRDVDGTTGVERTIGERSEKQVGQLLSKLINLASTDEYGGFDLMRAGPEVPERMYESFTFSTYPSGSSYLGTSITVHILEKAW